MGEVRVIPKVEVLVGLPVMPFGVSDDPAKASSLQLVEYNVNISLRAVLEHVDLVFVSRIGEPVLVDGRSCLSESPAKTKYKK